MIRYLTKNYKGVLSAGNKAKTDVEDIMSSMGISNVGIKRTFFKNKIISFLYTFCGIIKLPFSLKKGDVLVLQYPIKKYFALICNIAHLKECKVICIIHDLGCFRRHKITLKEECRRLNKVDCIIGHNENMNEWLKANNFKPLLTKMLVWDYLSTSVSKKHSFENVPSIVYAGGLSHRKNEFIYSIADVVKSANFFLYGNGLEIDKVHCADRVNYKGFILPDELISNVDGNYGLVWDGFSTDACDGDWGSYLRYNNPHKTSLYIRCGLPLIVWDKAAMATFVKDNGIGICVSSLTELDSVLSSINEEKYYDMCRRVNVISERISNGYYCKNAINSALNLINVNKI